MSHFFLGNLKKFFCLWCTFLEELTIHDHESLLQAENFKTLPNWELLLEDHGMPDHTHMNGLNQIDVLVCA